MDGGKRGRPTVRTVLIAGGGIAGLTCAINLAARGIPVEIHEAKRYCGKAIRDFEFLENWTFTVIKPSQSK